MASCLQISAFRATKPDFGTPHGWYLSGKAAHALGLWGAKIGVLPGKLLILGTRTEF